MQSQGYPAGKLRLKLLHFLRLYPDMFGAVSHKSLYEAVIHKRDELLPEVIVQQHATAFT
jgi:hypothetical protein